MQIIVLGGGPDAGLFHIPKDPKPTLLRLSMHYASPRDSDLGFAMNMDAGPDRPDLWPLVQMAAERAQLYVDKAAMDGHSLMWTLTAALVWMDDVAQRIHPRKGPRPADALAAMTGLIVLRTFGLAADADEDNGFVPVWYLEPREFPVVKWNGTPHAAGNA